MKEVKILSVNGQLGYGYAEASFMEGMRRGPDIIGVDGGSTDGGPYYLGSGTSLTGAKGIRRDLSIALPAALKAKVPLIIGSASTAGADVHIQRTLDIIKDIAKEQKLKFKVAIIHSEIDKEFLKKKLKAGKITPLGSHVPQLTNEEIDKSVRIVGQMGVAPFLKALDCDVQVILAGRSCDTAIFAALPIKHGLGYGLSFHAAKILECGAYGLVPGTAADCMWGVIRENDFTLDSLNPARKCTPVSAAAHTMYEQGHPSIFYEPDGAVDCSEAQFEQVSPTAVRVWGSKHVPAQPGKWTIKLEGAALEGYRAISIVGARDPYLIKHVDELTRRVTDAVADSFGTQEEGGYKLIYRVYGKNAILKDMEYAPCTASEVGIVIDAVADTQDYADSICALARSQILHQDYPERRTTGGNVAMPYSPADISVGPVYRFSVYHLVEVEDSAAPFPIEIMEVSC